VNQEVESVDEVVHISGGASAVKKPGHFEVRKSSTQVTLMHFLPQKVDDLFVSCRPQNKGRQRRFTVKIKQSGQIW